MSDAVPAPPMAHNPAVSRLEDLFVFSPRIGAGRPRAYPIRKRSPGKKILGTAMSILLLAGGMIYFGATEAMQELLGRWFPSRGSVPEATVGSRPAYEIREMKSAVHEQAVAGNLFVVSGTVVNVGKGSSRGIQVLAALLGEDNRILMENSSVAGNLIDEYALRHMTRNPIEADLKMEHKEGGEHRDILPGKSLPFMVVFFDPPGKIESFTVRAADAD